MTEKNPLSKQDIINWSMCPNCGAAAGTPCFSDYTDMLRAPLSRGASHYGRMRRAQRLVKAVPPKRISKRERVGLSLAFVAIVVAGCLAVVFGNAVLDYTLYQFGF